VTYIDKDAAVIFRGFIRNVRVTDSGGATKQVLWASGDVTGTTYASGSVSSPSTKPMNTFRAYAFTDAGAQSAKDVRWQFTGV
jgi:hypothetical protein